MNKKSPSRNKIVVIASVVAALGVAYLAWWYAGSAPVKPPAPQVAQEKPAAPGRTTTGEAVPPPAPVVTAPTAPMDRLTTVEEGDQMIDEILRSGKEIPGMARDLHELVKKLNSEAQVNASRHLVNLTTDEDYGLISGFLVDDKMNPDVIEVLFSDLMNRKRELQLPLFMNILRNPKHPQNEQVRNVMTILAGQDYGQDFNAWDRWASAEIKAQQGQ